MTTITTQPTTSTFDTARLAAFYSRLFPYEEMYEWLSYSSGNSQQQQDAQQAVDYFFHREFSFTKEGDVYIRYLTFRSVQEFKDAVKQHLPHKIDIGAVYSSPARDHKSSIKFAPVERELVFDIDLTDYTEVRVGAEKGDAMWAKNAWCYMGLAIQILDRALREDFGFKHLLWVYSGRRGIHCWVCDSQARQLTDDVRASVAKYLSLTEIKSGQSHEGDVVEKIKLTTPLHPAIQRALEMCTRVFDQYIVPEEEGGQGLMSSPEKWKMILAQIPRVENLHEDLEKDWEKNVTKSSVDRWKDLKATVKNRVSKMKDPILGNRLLRALDSIVLYYTYPRLDVDVSIHRNHLLKSPFVVHPKTGNVCVPILDVDRAMEFNPDHVPNLFTLIEEIDMAHEKMDNDAVNKKPKRDYESTSLKKYIVDFKRKFLEPMQMEKRKLQQQQQQQQTSSTTSDVEMNLNNHGQNDW
jgi:DNA primase small subunit